MAAISNGVEFLLMVQESQKQGFSDDHKLLSQPSIWIGDTAANCCHNQAFGLATQLP